MLNKSGERELAYIVKIDAVDPIPGYDRIERATVNGWHCVVGKGMAAGDLAVYFEIDSLLPATDERFAFCEKYKYRIKTQRMCKGAVISQGLVMPLSAFPELAGCAEGDFVTARLGVKYYEPEDNVRKAPSVDKYKKMATRHQKLFSKRPIRWLMRRDWGKRLLFIFFGKKRDKKSGWPAWVAKTDEERIQNCPWLLNSEENWVLTEKIDGSSTTFSIKRNHWPRKNEFYVCSRNVSFDSDGKGNCFYDTNIYTEMAEKYHMRDVLEAMLKERPDEKWITIQGETFGAGVQKRDYGMKEHDFMAFNLVYSTLGRVGTLQMVDELNRYGIQSVPVIGMNDLPKTVDEMVALASGASMIDGGMREGLVCRSLDGAQSFKAVSPEYLLKYHG